MVRTVGQAVCAATDFREGFEDVIMMDIISICNGRQSVYGGSAGLREDEWCYDGCLISVSAHIYYTYRDTAKRGSRDECVQRPCGRYPDSDGWANGCGDSTGRLNFFFRLFENARAQYEMVKTTGLGLRVNCQSIRCCMRTTVYQLVVVCMCIVSTGPTIECWLASEQLS